jgi:hypothetical protein
MTALRSLAQEFDSRPVEEGHGDDSAAFEAYTTRCQNIIAREVSQWIKRFEITSTYNTLVLFTIVILNYSTIP